MSIRNSRVQALSERFWTLTGAVSVRTKILGIALSLVTLLGVIVILVVRTSLHNVVSEELNLLAAEMARNLAARTADAILVNNQYALYQLITETKSNNPDIRYIFIQDYSGKVIAHTFGPGFPAELLTANFITTGDPSNVKTLNTTEGLIWDAAAPIFDGRIGTIRIGFSDGLLTRTVNVVTTQLIMATLLVLTFGIIAAILLTRVLTKPILQLAKAASAVGKGDLDQQVSRWANDEIGQLSESFNNMVMNLRLAAEANQERERLRAELVEKVIDAQEAERKRIACDLHDQTSQALVSLIVQLKLIEKAQNDSTRGKNIEIFRDQLRIALEDVRQMALDLRPNVLDDLGLEQAIHWFADRCSQNNGLKVSVRTSGDFRDLPERYLVTIYRVIQESLSNVVKHSHAQSTLVELIREPDLIYVKVADDGKGFKVNNPYGKKDSLGILGMKERISLLGGQFELQSKPGNGVTISASIPIELSYQQNKTQCEESR